MQDSNSNTGIKEILVQVPLLTLGQYMTLTGEDPADRSKMTDFDVYMREQVVSMVNDGFIDLVMDEDGMTFLSLTEKGYNKFIAPNLDSTEFKNPRVD